MNILIGVPVPESISPKLIGNILSLIAYTKSQRTDIDNLWYVDQGGVRTDRNRNIILSQALEKEVDYILWLDADMVYPPDMIVKYLQWKFDVMGCLYFKREYPYSVVPAIKNPNKESDHEYRSIYPPDLQADTAIEIDALGFGGMMVDMKVYKAMGDDKWMNYGNNFHLPFTGKDRLSHDFEFCKKAQEYGFKIHLHSGVKAGHIAEHIVTELDWQRARQEQRAEAMPGEIDQAIVDNPKITVFIPTTNLKQAKQTARLMKSRAGVPCEVIIIEDKNRTGYVATINAAVQRYHSDYYIYAAQDAYPGRNWLKLAYDTMIEKNAGLVAFNDGKWSGALASFGMVSESFRKRLPYPLMHQGYTSHYGDTELTLFARYFNTYCYNPDAVLLEIDYDKDTKSVNMEDKKLFNQRKTTLFPAELQGLFG